MPLIDTADLISADEVADLLDLASYRAVHVYRARYDDFPEPLISKGRCLLWIRADIEAWRSR